MNNWVRGGERKIGVSSDEYIHTTGNIENLMNLKKKMLRLLCTLNLNHHNGYNATTIFAHAVSLHSGV